MELPPPFRIWRTKYRTINTNTEVVIVKYQSPGPHGIQGCSGVEKNRSKKPKIYWKNVSINSGCAGCNWYHLWYVGQCWHHFCRILLFLWVLSVCFTYMSYETTWGLLCKFLFSCCLINMSVTDGRLLSLLGVSKAFAAFSRVLKSQVSRFRRN